MLSKRNSITDKEAFGHLFNPQWRINHLYSIKDSAGNCIKYRPNWAQKQIVDDPHPCKLVLKARQLGITTAFCLAALDEVLFTPGIQAGIIAQTLEDAQKIFQDKLKFAFDHLDPRIRAMFRVVGDSARELAFTNGSCIRVGTSLRGSTLQILHVSEFGKICARYPERAREVITGSLQTVHIGQKVTIESTAEGKEGYFYDMCKEAFKHEPTSPLEFKAFFFPWHKHPEYTIGVPTDIPEHLQNYFHKLSLDGLHLSDAQKWWYVKKYNLLKEDMFREFPSKPDEAFFASQEGYWYAAEMKGLHDAGRVTSVSYNRSLPVHCAWDLGQRDAMAIWFFQVQKSGDINCIDYFQRTKCPIDQIANILKEKGYTYGTHLWPHDAEADDRAGTTFVKQARAFGLTGSVLPISPLIPGINLVRTNLNRFWFDGKKCHQGLLCLENYAKAWNSTIGGFTSVPVHNEFSHGSDAFRYLCEGLPRIEGGGDLTKDYKALNRFWGIS